jgi:hypothetical protein
MKDILNRIESFPDTLKAISVLAKKYIDNSSNIVENVMNILHRPWVAPLNWGLMLYIGASNDWFDVFRKRSGKEIPDFYKEFLNNINGGFIFGMSFYGLTPSIYNTGLLNRTILQCHDLATANSDWIREYNVNPSLFHFAGRRFTDSENVGYFYGEGKILCYRKNGELIKEWMNFGELLFDEIYIVEQMMLKEVPDNIILRINE